MITKFTLSKQNMWWFMPVRKNVTNLNLIINQSITEIASQFNFLGIMIYYNKILDTHLSHNATDENETISISHQLNLSIFNLCCLLCMYNTLIKLHLNYCLTLCGSDIKKNDKSLHQQCRKYVSKTVKMTCADMFTKTI